MHPSGIFKKLSSLSFILLSFYPILPFHYSSILLITFLVSAIVLNYSGFINRVSSTTPKIIIIHAGYYLVLILSLIYSDNLNAGVDRVLQLSPLFFVPFVLIYFTPIIKASTKNIFSILFVFSNLIYTFLLYKYLIAGIDLNSDVSIIGNSFAKNISTLYELGFNQTFWFANLMPSSSIFFHKAYFSMNYLLSLVIVIDILFKSRRFSIYYWTSLAFGIIFSIAIIYAFSFPNVFSLLFILLVVPIYYYPHWQIKQKALFYLSIITVVVFMSYLIIIMQANNIDIRRGINFVKSIVTQESREDNDPRFEIYKTTIEIIKANPVFGVGVGDAEDVLLDSYIQKNKQLSNDKNHNYIRFSEKLNDAYWHKNDVTVSSNTSIAPDKNLTVDKITANYKGQAHNISQTVILDNDTTIYTFSVFAKALDTKYLILRLGDISSQQVSFDLKTKQVGNSGSKIIKSSINQLDNQWYRYSITTECAGSVGALIGQADSIGIYNYFATGESIELWGAMVEKGDSATLYNKSNNPLIKYAIEENLNTHNNYLYFMVAGGLLCLFLFLTNIIKLLKISIGEKSHLLISFSIIIILNLLTENIFSRHFGLMFYSVFIILLFNNLLLNKTVREQH